MTVTHYIRCGRTSVRLLVSPPGRGDALRIAIPNEVVATLPGATGVDLEAAVAFRTRAICAAAVAKEHSVAPGEEIVLTRHEILISEAELD